MEINSDGGATADKPLLGRIVPVPDPCEPIGKLGSRINGVPHLEWPISGAIAASPLGRHRRQRLETDAISEGCRQLGLQSPDRPPASRSQPIASPESFLALIGSPWPCPPTLYVGPSRTLSSAEALLLWQGGLVSYPRRCSRRNRHLQYAIALTAEQLVGLLDLVELEPMCNERPQIDTLRRHR